MGNPLLIKDTVGGTFLGLQEMQATDVNYSVHKILVEFSTSNIGSGCLTVDGPGTAAGTFTDTIRNESVGTHPSTNSISSSTYTLTQNLVSVSESSVVFPLFVDTEGYATENSNSLNDTIISTALANLVSNGLGSYWMSQTNPNDTLYTDTGSTITDTNIGGGSVVYRLWRKTTGVSAPTVARPVKIQSSSIKEMTDEEIATLTARFRNRLASTGIGSYRLSSVNPAAEGETWVQVSDDLTDTRNELLDTEYSATYIGLYSKQYEKAYIGQYTKQYTKEYEGSFDKSYTKIYTKTYIGQYTKTYTGVYEGAFTGYFSKQYEGQFAKQYEGQFVGTFTGIYVKSYLGEWEKGWTATYTGLYSRQFEGTFTKQYEGTYAGYFDNTYSRVFLGQYTKAYSGDYVGTFTGIYTKQYEGSYWIGKKRNNGTKTI